MLRALSCFGILLLAAAARSAEYDVGSVRQVLIDDPLQIEFPSGMAPGAEKLRHSVQVVAGIKGWRVESETEGRTRLAYEVPNRHFARIELLHQPDGYRVVYVDSLHLLYGLEQRSGGNLRVIHRNYNKWVREFVSALNKGLGAPGKVFVGSLRIHDVDAVPYLTANGRQVYRTFLESSPPRAFAIAPTGVVGLAATQTLGIDVVAAAMKECLEKAPGACRVYAVDQRVVWRDQ